MLNIQSIKSDDRVYRSLINNIPNNPNTKFLSPFRAEKEPSCTFFKLPEDGTFIIRDWGSGKSFNVVDAYLELNHCQFKQFAEWIEKQFPEYHQAEEKESLQSYLSSHGLKLSEVLEADCEPLDSQIIFKIKSTDGSLIGNKYRKFTNNKKERFHSDKGISAAKYVYFNKLISTSKLIICAGEIDCINAQKHFKDAQCVGVLGEGNIPLELIDLAKNFTDIYIIFDNELFETENKFKTKKLAEAINRPIKIVTWADTEFKNIKDVSELCAIRGRSALDDLIKNFERVGFKYEISQEIAEIEDGDYSIYQKIQKYSEISKREKIAISQLMKLSKAYLLEKEFISGTENAAYLFSKISTQRAKRLNVYEYFHENLARLIEDRSRGMSTAPEFFITCLLPIAASLIGGTSQIIVRQQIKYKRPCIVYAGFLCGTGHGKSPILNAMMDPLKAMQKQAYDKYEREKKDYDLKLAEHEENKKLGQKLAKQFYAPEIPDEPRLKKYFATSATVEALQRAQKYNKGFLMFYDELEENFRAYNQYKGGKGTDVQAELKMHGGDAVAIERKDESVYFDSSCVSRLGAGHIKSTITAVKESSGEADERGLLARWLLCAVDVKPSELNDHESGAELEDTLRSLYERLNDLEGKDYFLSNDCWPIFKELRLAMINRAEAAQKDSIKALYPKIEDYAARLTLILHIVNATLTNQIPPQTIGIQTLRKGISLAYYYMYQAEYIHYYNDESEDGKFHKLFAQIRALAVKKGGKVKPRDIKVGIRACRDYSIAEIVNIVQNLVKALNTSEPGSALFEESDMSLVLTDKKSLKNGFVDIVDTLLTPECQQVPTLEPQGFEGVQNGIVDIVDTKPPPLKKNDQKEETPKKCQQCQQISTTLEPQGFEGVDKVSTICQQCQQIEKNSIDIVAQMRSCIDETELDNLFDLISNDSEFQNMSDEFHELAVRTYIQIKEKYENG